MYLFRESSPNNYFVDYRVGNRFIESYYISIDGSKATCSCRHFNESKNRLNHFHINLVEHWIKDGKPFGAMYDKSLDGKIKVLFAGIKQS